MISKTEAIILGVINYKEKNLILKAYSKSEGLKTYYLSRPSGNSKRRDKNNYQPFSILELVTKRRSKGGMPRITESKNIHLLLNLRSNIGKNTMSFLLCEVLAKCIQEEGEDPPLYEFIETQILALDQCENSFSNFHLYFISQLTRHLGICPDLSGDNNNFFDIKEGEFTNSVPGHPQYLRNQESMLFQKLLAEPWANIQTIKLSGQKRTYLLSEILKYYQYHIPGFEQPKSLEVLNEVFNN